MELVEQISQHLQQQLELQHLKLFLNGNHLTVVCCDPRFSSLTKIKSHQLIYKGLNNYIATGEVHAVYIHAYSNFEEYQEYLNN